jgi:uncharacterized surface protein with fasciclin (FAS1) repeats
MKFFGEDRFRGFAAVAVAGMVLVAASGAPAFSDNCSTHSKTAYAGKASSDIVDTAVAAGSFETLAAALQAAGLVDTLKGEGPFTVFAPTDEAFAKLPEGTVEALLNDIPKLQAILTYHVVAGKVMAADVVQLKKAETVNGQSVKIKVKGDSVMVDNARVVKTDILASNGVIHVIDSVILPKDQISTRLFPRRGRGRSPAAPSPLTAATFLGRWTP